LAEAEAAVQAGVVAEKAATAEAVVKVGVQVIVGLEVYVEITLVPTLCFIVKAIAPPLLPTVVKNVICGAAKVEPELVTVAVKTVAVAAQADHVKPDPPATHVGLVVMKLAPLVMVISTVSLVFMTLVYPDVAVQVTVAEVDAAEHVGTVVENTAAAD
jgi:hypothetical protein